MISDGARIRAFFTPLCSAASRFIFPASQFLSYPPSSFQLRPINPPYVSDLLTHAEYLLSEARSSVLRNPFILLTKRGSYDYRLAKEVSFLATQSWPQSRVFFLQEICPHPVLEKALGKEDVKRNQVEQLHICKSLLLFY